MSKKMLRKLDPMAVARSKVADANAKRPLTMTEVPREQWPPSPAPKFLARLWLSRDFIAQLYCGEQSGKLYEHVSRLSINRTTFQSPDRFDDGITWDQLQRIKRECGYGDFEAIEIYPPDDCVVNVANARHLWILHGARMPFSWNLPEVTHA